MENEKNPEKKILGKKISTKSETGIILLTKVFPGTPVTFILSFLKRYGDIHRSFFFPQKLEGIFNRKSKHPNITGIVEFTEKINAKRCSILVKPNLNQNLIIIPFEKALYLKKTNWKKLVSLLV